MVSVCHDLEKGGQRGKGEGGRGTYGYSQVIGSFELAVGDDLVADFFDVLGGYNQSRGVNDERKKMEEKDVPEAMYDPIEPVASCMNTKSLRPVLSMPSKAPDQRQATHIVFRPGSSFINPGSMFVAVTFAARSFIGTGPVEDGTTMRAVSSRRRQQLTNRLTKVRGRSCRKHRKGRRRIHSLHCLYPWY